MSLSNSIRISLNFSNVDIFTFGESTLFGYDSLNHCLIVLPLNELTNSTDQLINRLHLSLTPTYPIRQLILNEDETIVALISDKTVSIVYLPQSNNLSCSNGSRLCPVNLIPWNNSFLNNSLIDFLWLSSIDFLVVNSCPSSSECHLYKIRPSKLDGIEYIQTFSVGSLTTTKGKTTLTPNKKVSLHQPSDIVKLDLAKRKQQDLTLILIFAMKSDGDIYIMEIDQDQLINNEGNLSCSFVGPIRILPSTFDNYGSNYIHSRLLCLSCSEYPVIVLTRDKCSINQCVVVNPTIDQYYFYTIDQINLSKNETNERILSMIKDKLNSNIYYVCDSLSNIYSIEILWINQIQLKQKQIQSTNIQHLIKSNQLIQQIGLIQTNNKGQWLAIITKTLNNQHKELILIRPHSLSLSSSLKSDSSIQSKPIDTSNVSSEFVNRIRRILNRDESLPHLTISSSSINISNSDFQTNLLKFLKIFSKEYLEKQDQVRIELENKQRYLFDFQQTQLVANQELYHKFEQIQQTIQTLNQQYQQEYQRRKVLSSNVDDLLSVIEQHTPVVSDAEILMQQQLERYQIQINSLQEKIVLLKQFISTEQNLNQNQQQINQSAMENIQIFVQYFKDEIIQMKQKIQTIDWNNET